MRKALLTAFLFLFLPTQLTFSDGITDGPEKAWDSSRYISTGNVFSVDSTTIGFCYRDAYTHGTGAASSAKYRTYSKTSRAWSGSEVTIYSDASVDVGDMACQVIGSQIHGFFVRRDLSGNFDDIVHVTSTDLTGSTWNSPTVVYTFSSGRKGHVHGDIITTGGTNWMLSFYSHDGSQTAGTWKVGLFESSDNGATWTYDETKIYGPSTGSVKFGETAIAFCGSGRVIALLRDQVGNYVGQSISLDSGATWTDADVDFTNLGASTGVKVISVYYEANTNDLLVIYVDRSSDNSLKMSVTNSDAVFSDPDNWENPFLVDNLFASGYSSMAKISNDEYIAAYFKEDVDPNTSSSRDLFDQDAWYFIYALAQGGADPDLEAELHIRGLTVRGLTVT